MKRYLAMADAPRDGTRVVLLLGDALGPYEAGVKFWNGQRWIGDTTGVPVHESVFVKGWRPVEEGD